MTTQSFQRHPEYEAWLPDWELCQHAYAGERTVKEMKQTYLPATPGQEEDGLASGQKGLTDYNSYLMRAVFPSYFEDAIDSILGMMHLKDAVIDLPAALEPMRERATPSGLSLQGVLRQFNHWQLQYGRGGALVEAPTGKLINEAVPYIVLYHPMSIVNWDDDVMSGGDGLPTLIVLNESGKIRGSDGLSWEDHIQFRVLSVAGVVDPTREEGRVDYGGASEVTADTYVAAVTDQNLSSLSGLRWMVPQIGGRAFDRIPFVVFNSSDLAMSVDRPPLLKLANLCMAIYRGEADYRQTLFMQGQQTLTVIGAELPKDTRVGAFGLLELPQGADAKFVGVSSDGLSEQREALANDKARAGDLTVRLFDGRTGPESGAALRTRVAARTASIMRVVRTGADALEELLRHCARVVGANPDEVKVTPNTDFVPDEVAPADLLALTNAKANGAPISDRTIHEWMRAREITKLSFEEEMAELDGDLDRQMGTPDGSGGPGGVVSV